MPVGDIKLLDDVAGFRDLVSRRLVMFNGTGGTLAKGDFVAIDISVTTHGLGTAIKQSPAAVDNVLVIGVAAEAIENLKHGEVIVAGLALDANVATGTAAEAGIQQSAVAGRAAVAGAITERALGFTLEVAAANKADVWLYGTA